MPRIRNIAPGYRGVNTTSGLVILAPDEVRNLEVSDEELQGLSEEWFKVTKVPAKEMAKEADQTDGQESGHDDGQSQSPVKNDEPPATDAPKGTTERTQLFQDALKAMPEAGYDAEGKPKLVALNAALPKGAQTFNAKELDQLWSEQPKG